MRKAIEVHLVCKTPVRSIRDPRQQRWRSNFGHFARGRLWTDTDFHQNPIVAKKPQSVAPEGRRRIHQTHSLRPEMLAEEGEILIEAVKGHMMEKFAFRFHQPCPTMLPGSRSAKRQVVTFLTHIEAKRLVEVLALLQLGYS